MQDDEINAIIQTMKEARVPPAQMRRSLDLLGRAEELSNELVAALVPSEEQKVQAAIAGAINKIFKHG